MYHEIDYQRREEKSMTTPHLCSFWETHVHHANPGIICVKIRDTQRHELEEKRE